MIKIALCDDDRSVLQELQVLLDRYRVEQNRDIDYTAFRSPLDLLAVIERGARFDILFLDILMPGENGIHAAAEIRNYDRDVKIIFLTSSPEYAVQSYSVGAYYYQLKPIRAQHFFPLLNSVLSTCEKEQSNSLILRCKTGITRIDLKHLEYCEVIHRTLYLHMTNGDVMESTGSLDELCSQLEPYGNFLRIHRSYLINLAHVHRITYQSITMSCLAELPIPRGKYNDVKNAFLEYAFQNKQVMI